MLQKDETLLVLIDIQGKLAEIVHDSESVIDHIAKVAEGVQILGLPVLWLEQYPKGLGPTVEKIANVLPNQKPIEKITFSAYDTPEFVEQLEATGRKKVLLAGIETHICVYQTAAQLIQNGFEVEVLADCTSSRTQKSHDIGLQKMMQLGVKLTTVEMALFEMLQIAKGDHFKAISKLVK
ncbi:hydrolase [Lysinibacillus yapensis]|uniref:Hydrolase n=1 Tax=Ureibacillus yapensis TaxID=2304605 RepID=A0A396S407_9BACL|nr:hydrolase [Lysinibacillus yapensis]RHW33431.1 hydrolase [Lysinibacillus yapensis]